MLDNYKIIIYIFIEAKMNIQKKLSNLLKQERESLDFTLKEVSEKLGFNNYQTLSSIEAGEREVKAWELAKLSKIYGRDIDYYQNLDLPQKEVLILWRSPETSPQKTIIKRQFISICARYQKLLKLLNEPKVSKTGLKINMRWIHQFQLFLFDFDGLLVNTEELHFLAYKKMCSNRGFNFDWSFERYCESANYIADLLKHELYEKFPLLYEMEPSWDVLYAEKKAILSP